MSKSKKTQSLLQMGLFLGIVVFINILANARLGNFALYRSFDLTEEKRFTLTDGTKNLLRNLDEVVYVKVMLDGKLPAELKRLRASTIDILDDFRGQSALIDYDFENPMAGKPEQVNARMEQLRKEGMFPMSFTVKKGAQRDETPIFPYAIVNYKGRAFPVNLMENQDMTQSPDVVLNNAVSLLEYKLANAIQKLQETNKPNVAFTMGHGEIGVNERKDFEGSLRKFCNTGTLFLDSVTSISPEISALIVAKPLRPFSEKDKFKIDQYVMGGEKSSGCSIWCAWIKTASLLTPNTSPATTNSIWMTCFFVTACGYSPIWYLTCNVPQSGSPRANKAPSNSASRLLSLTIS